MFNSKKRYARKLKKRATDAEKALYILRLMSFGFQKICYGTIPDYYSSVLRLALEVDGSVHRGKRKHTDDMRDSQRRYWGVYTLRVPNWEAQYFMPLVVLDVIVIGICWRIYTMIKIR